MRHDIYDDVMFRKVTVTVADQAVTVRGWIAGEFVAVTAGGGFGWKVHRMHPPGWTDASAELVRGLDRDVAIAIVHDAAKACRASEAFDLPDFQAILRVHLGGFAL